MTGAAREPSPGLPPPARSPVGGRALLALFAASLAIRIGGVVLHPPSDDGDQALYRGLARAIASGAGYVYEGQPNTHVHPLLPILDAVVLQGIRDERTAALVVSLVLGSLLPVVAAWVVGLALGRRAALIAGVLLALQPHHIGASARLHPELLGASLGFALAAALIAQQWIWGGVILGLAYLNRPEAIFFLPAAAVFAWVRTASARPVGRLVLATAIVASPFVLHVHRVEGRWALSGKDEWVYQLGVNQYRSGNQALDADRIPELRREVGSPLDHVTSHPGEFAAGYVYRSGILLENLGRQTGYGVLAAFAVFGLASGLKTSRAATWALLVPLAALPVLPIGATFFRHSVPAAAVVLALAGVGLARATDEPASGGDPLASG
jgi:4-amino-4-deoxy-L-arabinose transferase-like glycosyltransferase